MIVHHPRSHNCILIYSPIRRTHWVTASRRSGIGAVPKGAAPGIGVITAADAYGEWSSLTRATSPKKLVKYGGLDPIINGSGTRPDR